MKENRGGKSGAKLNAESARSTSNINEAGTVIFLDRPILSEMHSHASSTFPEECCGLLLGSFEDDKSRIKRILKSRRMKNMFAPEERYHRYTIDPQEFMLAEGEAESEKMEIVGIYHSHPNAPAKPSLFDQNHAWPVLSYVVIEVRDSRPVETRSWLLKEDRSEFLQEEMKIS